MLNIYVLYPIRGVSAVKLVITKTRNGMEWNGLFHPVLFQIVFALKSNDIFP